MWRTEVTRLIYWLLKLFQLQVFCFCFFDLGKLKSEQVRHRYHIRWGGRLVWCRQMSASARRSKDGPKHPKQSRETCE